VRLPPNRRKTVVGFRDPLGGERGETKKKIRGRAGLGSRSRIKQGKRIVGESHSSWLEHKPRSKILAYPGENPYETARCASPKGNLPRENERGARSQKGYKRVGIERLVFTNTDDRRSSKNSPKLGGEKGVMERRKGEGGSRGRDGI